MDGLLTNYEQLGPLLLAFIAINKLLDIVGAQVKTAIDARRANGSHPPSEKDLLGEVAAQSRKNGALLEGMRAQVEKLTKVVIDGNGQPGLVTLMALTNQRLEAAEKGLEAHIGDEERHCNRRRTRRTK
jgi:hypothetical protein